MLILSCSPHAGGSCEVIGDILARTSRSNDELTEFVRLREQRILPCNGCGFCRLPVSDGCHQDIGGADDTFAILHAIRAANLTIFVLPVYFYGPPAIFKALVDRAQFFWNKKISTGQDLRPARAVILGARTRGERLFDANLLILRCFLSALGFQLYNPLLLRGIETPEDVHGNAEVLAQLEQFGKESVEMAMAYGSEHPSCPFLSER